MNEPSLPLTLYIDLDCPLCAREVHWLQRHASPARLQLVDISAPGFDPAPTGRSLQALHDCLHARSASGEWLTGIDATLWSWRAAGVGHWAAPLAWRPLRPLLRLAYWLFSLLRPSLGWLPHPDGSRRCRDACPPKGH
jgi:predicted DCC family thiol-disulfide oxidoreductase YuxK